ncbi:hypothetical protein BV898_14098 [Hypsibius exemplaris]|uniref:Helicase C-terminal domain-containing protein n=1 Tax=Hypsibius exemplaris TaxID=2072580 RepID=A0A1W0W8V3_HYPEX|nr:hypothetical protein BV898_14098 [Hypsibius exemplaris]
MLKSHSRFPLKQARSYGPWMRCLLVIRLLHQCESRNKLDAPLHASQSWKKRSAGDCFTIRAFGENPAMLECQQDAVRGFEKLELQHPVRDAFNDIELKDISDYIHHTGRTGRIGASDRDQVTSFITYPDEAEIVHKIERAVRDAKAFENVNANITRRINIKHGMTHEELKNMGKMEANIPLR